MNTAYIPLLLLFSFVFLYKASFWLYVIQLKEYRLDRFTEYYQTKQGKAALFNFWFILELILGILAILLFFNPLLEYMFYPIVFSFLIFESIFVFGKVFRRKLLLPRVTGRLILTLLILLVLFVGILLSQLTATYSAIIYLAIFCSFILLPLLVFTSIFISLPIVNHQKNKKMNKAIQKSKDIENVVKVAITGSFGKSSMKTYLSQILSTQYKTLATPENINTELGVSNIVITKLKDTFEYFVAEVGAYKIGEISLLGKIVNHKHGFLSGIGTQHLGLFGSQENIKKGKFEILEKVIENNGKLYVNYDNGHIQDYIEENKLDEKYIVKYGVHSQEADIKGQIVGIKNALTQFNIFKDGEKYEFETELIGDHNIVNLTGVIGFCFDRGMTYAQIQEGLKNVRAPKNTLEVYKKRNSVLIDDSYNLSEDGLIAGLDAASSFGKDKNIYLVLDDILELGSDAENKHTVIAERIVKNYNIKNILFVGKNYRKAFEIGLKNAGGEGLLTGKFDMSNNEELIYLFEGKNAGRYFDKAMN